MVGKKTHFGEHYESLRSLARRLLSGDPRQSATDLVHTVFKRLPDSLSQVEKRTRYVEQWLRKHARPKKARAGAALRSDETVKQALAAPASEIDEETMILETVEELRPQHPEAIGAFESHHLLGVPVKDLAALRGCSEARVRKRIDLGRVLLWRRLREKLDDQP